MSALLAGSIALIAGSSVALIIGWLNANEGFIWTSIAATAGAFALLVLAYVRSSKLPRAVQTTEAPAEEASAEGEPGTPAQSGMDTAVMSPAGMDDATEVVAVARTKKFHRPDCRFAAAKGGETVSRGAAAGRGFAPCGVCKP